MLHRSSPRLIVRDAGRSETIAAGQIVKGVKPADLPVVQVDQVRVRHQHASRFLRRAISSVNPRAPVRPPQADDARSPLPTPLS
jgi:hypothetical protein